MNESINNIETELFKLFRDAGVADINTGNIYKAAPKYPAVDIILTSAEQNELQVMQNGRIGWDLTYEISCMFTGSEGNQTYKNARKFVNQIYDLIQSQKDTRLNDTVWDLNCEKISYGRTTILNELADGGLINLSIQIFEVR